MTEDPKLTAVRELVEHVAERLRPLYPAASQAELLDITVGHLLGHLAEDAGVQDEERAEYWYLQTYRQPARRGDRLP